MRTARSIFLSLLAITIISAAGCAASPLSAAMPARSLSLDSPQQRALADSQNLDGAPWYLARNDVQASVAFGTESQTYQRTDTYTYDQTNAYDGQVYENYNQTHFRRSVQETSH